MAEIENLEKGTREAAETEVQLYTLRNYDKDLAKSGFECVMITGNHYEGTNIDLSNGDIMGNQKKAAIVYPSGYAEFTISDKTYTFYPDGTCKAIDVPYRLMLVEEQPNNNIVSLLSKISEAIGDINEGMTAMQQGLSDIASAISSLELSPTINNYIEIPEE